MVHSSLHSDVPQLNYNGISQTPPGLFGKHVRRHCDWPYRGLRGTHEGPFPTPGALAPDPSCFSILSAVRSVDNFGWSQISALVPADKRHSRVILPVLWISVSVYSFDMDGLDHSQNRAYFLLTALSRWSKIAIVGFMDSCGNTTLYTKRVVGISTEVVSQDKIEDYPKRPKLRGGHKQYGEGVMLRPVCGTVEICTRIRIRKYEICDSSGSWERKRKEIVYINKGHVPK